MKRIIVTLTLVLLIISIGCSQKGPDMSKTDKVTWSTVKSPLTGRCYECLTSNTLNVFIGLGFMGMAEIPCEEMKQHSTERRK